MSRYVDLTMPWPDVPTYPGHPEPRIERVANFETHGKQVSKLEIGTHSGTHIDAPRHFIEGGATVDSIPLDVLCGPAVMLDFTEPKTIAVGAMEIEQRLDDAYVERILFRFDGDKRLGSFDYYEKQPWLTKAAALWLIERGCKLIGLDTPMPDSYANIDTMPIHKLLLGSGVVIVEYMVNLRAIQAETFQLIVAPLKIKDGDGAPARCFAIVQD